MSDQSHPPQQGQSLPHAPSMQQDPSGQHAPRPGIPGTVLAAMIVGGFAVLLTLLGLVLALVRYSLAASASAGSPQGGHFAVGVLMVVVTLLVLIPTAIQLFRLPSSVGAGRRTGLTLLIVLTMFFSLGNSLGALALLWIAVLVLLFVPPTGRWLAQRREADDAERARRRAAYKAREHAARASGNAPE